jgi:hypothetical protein
MFASVNAFFAGLEHFGTFLALEAFDNPTRTDAWNCSSVLGKNCFGFSLPFNTYCLWVFGAKSGPPATNKTSILLINPLETSLDIGASTSKLMLVERKSW